MTLARDDSGLWESDNNGSSEKVIQIQIYFQGRTNEISLWIECNNVNKIKRGVKNDSIIFAKMAQWSHHPFRWRRLGKTVWEGRQVLGVQ